MSLVDDIKALQANLIPDNNNNEISPKDVRDAEALPLDNWKQISEEETGDVFNFSTYAKMTADNGVVNVVYKVSNDPTPANNGYYHWSGSAYIKDAELVKDVALLSNKSDGVSGYAVQEELKNKPNLTIGKNKANINDPDSAFGYYTKYTTGALVVLAGYNVTSFIPVEEVTDYYLSFKSDIAWYDENKEFISGSASSDTSKHQVSPSGAKYLRCTVSTGSWASFQVEEGSVGTTYEAFEQTLDPSFVAVESIVEESNTTKPVSGEAVANFNKDEIAKIQPKEVIVNGIDSGTALKKYFSSTIWGWGSQQENSFDSLRYFKIIRDNTYSNTNSANVTARLYGSNVSGTYGSELANFTFPIATYLALAEGAEFEIDYGSQIDVSGYDYLTLMLFYDAGLSVKQTQDLVKGFYTLNGTTILNVVPPQYGLWWQASEASPIEQGILINEFEVPFFKTYKDQLEGLANTNTFLSAAKILANVKDFPNWLNKINKGDEDFYLMLYGNSITAWQSSLVNAEEGVCDVPPVCDRKGFANRIFKVLKFGSPIYKRFDWGKASLVSFWDDRWSDDTNAFFVESGTWKTFYYGGRGRPANIYTVPNYSTEITNEVCPIAAFTEVDTQRNIPKRISNGASSYVEFTIPAGYQKFDFVYHEHIDGDICAVTVSEGSGKVLVNTKQNDWSNGIEGNGYNLDTVKVDDVGGFNDDYGVLQKRLHFRKVDVNEELTIRITKSASSSKWLMYWGVSYWGTIALPNAFHIIANGRGGYAMSSLNGVLGSDIARFEIDGMLFEDTLINNLGTTGVGAGGVKKDQTGFTDSFDVFKAYLDAKGVEFYNIIPHLTKTVNDANPQAAREYYKGIKSYIVELGLNVFDIEQLFRNVWELYFSQYTYSEFIQLLMYDSTTHPNENGFDIYEGFLTKLIS